MNNKKIVAVLFLVCISLTCLLGQSKNVIITGKLIDAETSEPIPYANIYFEENYFGTMSNEEGEFELKTASLPATFMVSHIAYFSQQFTADRAQMGILKLGANNILLNEISISLPQSEINHIINVAKTNMQPLNYGKAFFRKLQKVDKTYTELQEMFFDVSFSSQRIEGWIPRQARYSLPKNEKDRPFSFENFIYLTTVRCYREEEGDILNPLSNRASEYYDLNLAGVRKDGNRKIAEIRAKLKENIMKPAMEGSFFYDMKSHDLVELRWYINHDLGVQTNPEKPSKECRYEFIVSFKPPKDSRIFLDKIEVDFKGEVYAANKYRHVHIHSVCFVYEYNLNVLDNEGFAPISMETHEMEEVGKLQYDAKFWDNNPIIKRSGIEREVIKSFKKIGIVGNSKFTISSQK